MGFFSLLTRVRSALLVSTLLIGSALCAAPTQAMERTGKDERGLYASGRLLVQPAPGLSKDKFLDILAKRAAVLDREIPGIGVGIVKVPPGLEKKIADELSAEQGIGFAEFDRQILPVFTANDPSIGSQWHIPKIGAPAAWDTASANGIVIAILDTGVDPAHPDLAAAMVPGWNSVSANTDTTDVQGHGTSTAGTAAAIVNNAVGVAGVAKDAKIMPIRITNDPAGYAYWSDLARGLTWAANHGARVANASYKTSDSSTVTSAARYLKDRGGLYFSSAGNDSADLVYADNPEIVTVSATDSSDNKASWSNYGVAVDLAAPGVGIYTTAKGGGYRSANGTSFSSPAAAGLAALVFGVNPALSPYDVEAIMESSAYDKTGTGFSTSFGHGRVDAAAAVALAATWTPTVRDTTAPTASITSPRSNDVIKGLVTVDVAASDNIGVTRVELYVNGALHATDTASPFSFQWDTTPMGNTSANLAAYAYDAAGNRGVSSSVAVSVQNIEDTTAPTVTISSPANGAKVPSTKATITASAVDDLGVVKMNLLIDGAQTASSTTGSLNYNWNTRKVKTGSHTIVVQAFDAKGNQGTSSIIVYR